MHKEMFATKIKHIWLQPDAYKDREYSKQVMEELEAQFSNPIEILDAGLEDSLQF